MSTARGDADQVAVVKEAFEREHATTWQLLSETLDDSVSEFPVSDAQPAHPNAKPRVCGAGELIEKAACNFTHSNGPSLPSAASARNPELANKPFSASALSVIVHPRHPHIPTAHMNVRFFFVEHGVGHWHFGGGLDLTPYVLYEEDAIAWHERARAACVNEDAYQLFKGQCDDYFFLPHRQEARGIGGLFFDDLVEPDFATCLEFAVNVCEAFRIAYAEIFERRKHALIADGDEAWMLHRRSRYAEFNLIHDRGTKYGLQSGRRIESVLASMPPRASWEYGRQPETAAERALLKCLRSPRDWV